MTLLKDTIKKIAMFRHLAFVIKANPKLFTVVTFFSMTSGILEGFGLSMFLPLLINSDKQSEVGRVVSSILFFLKDLGVATELQATLMVMIFVFLVRNVSRYFELYFKAVFERNFIFQAQEKVLKGIFKMKYSDYLTRFAPGGTSLLTTDITVLSQAISNLLAFVVNTGTALALSIAALAINPWATLFGILFGAVLFLILKAVGQRTRKLSMEVTETTMRFINRCQEIFDFFKYLRSTEQFELLQKNALQEAKSQRNGFIEIQSSAAVVFSLNQFLAILFLCSVIFFAVEIREQPVARVIISIGIMYRIISMITNALGSWQFFLGQIGAVESVRRNLALIDSSRPDDGETQLEYFSKGVQFVDVSYHQQGRDLIQDVNFEIKKGAFVALVGKTGAGKSLLTQLMTGLITPTSGSVLIDGIPLQKLKGSHWRRKIGFVPQELGVFTGTFREAICGKSKLETEGEATRFEQVLRQTSLLEVVMILPQGLETMVGRGGHPLSGGQKQRVALARELFRDPEILILDEATNALDQLTQELIAQVLESIRGSKTVIMIAHRLRMVEKADHVIVLSDGKIFLEGGPPIIEKYRQLMEQESEESISERRPSPRLWVGERDDVFLSIPKLSNEHLKVTDLSLTGLSFQGLEEWFTPENTKTSFEGFITIEAKVCSVSVRPVRTAAGRVGALFINPSSELSLLVQGFLAESLLVDIKKTG